MDWMFSFDVIVRWLSPVTRCRLLRKTNSSIFGEVDLPNDSRIMCVAIRALRGHDVLSMTETRTSVLLLAPISITAGYQEEIVYQRIGFSEHPGIERKWVDVFRTPRVKRIILV